MFKYPIERQEKDTRVNSRGTNRKKNKMVDFSSKVTIMISMIPLKLYQSKD